MRSDTDMVTRRWNSSPELGIMAPLKQIGVRGLNVPVDCVVWQSKNKLGTEVTDLLLPKESEKRFTREQTGVWPS